MKDLGSNAVLLLQGFETTVLEFKNAVVLVVFIFLMHNGLCGINTVHEKLLYEKLLHEKLLPIFHLKLVRAQSAWNNL